LRLWSLVTCFNRDSLHHELLIERFQSVRSATERLSAPLSPEDQALQSMPDASPTKWHRAHTSWFFETFLLGPNGVPPYDSRWGFLFNSYYESLGPRHSRPKRGLLSRPSADEVSEYRRVVDERVCLLLSQAEPSRLPELAAIVGIGLAHEEQHQELILTDILHALSCHPFQPRYRSAAPMLPAREAAEGPTSVRYFPYEGGLVTIGAPADGSFRFDNEEPVHRVWLEPFELSERLVTVEEWKAFARAGGYETPSLWLSEGFDWVHDQGVCAPLYAGFREGRLLGFGLDGERELDDAEPIVHVSYYEADAIARFLGARLPSEAEWELAAQTASRNTPSRVRTSHGTTRDPHLDGNFRESGALRPLPAEPGASGPRQLFGDAWEWTSSSYSPYPGYAPNAGALGEYNGKFMVNQMVLRGGSCFTPRAHVRASYRNFWPPHTRFQMSGIRLARSTSS
jgi:ergothioneine biosynthesis protein EgtB